MSPILFIIFNRKDVTEKSFEAIRKARPKRLYVAADGPRSNQPGEDRACEETRKIVEKVDWDCEVKTNFQNQNLGCKNGVVTAINWFFANEEEGIILEDDIVPNQQFFPFMDLMLKKYRYTSEIKAILGFNQFGQNVKSNSYYYSRGFYAWGWATWRSSWEHFIINVKPDNILQDRSLRKIYDISMLRGINFNLKLISARLLDTWDYQMIHMIVVNKGYTVVPFANLTSNIGANGAHSVNNTNIYHKYGELEVSELEYPKQIEDNHEMNQMLWKDYQKASYIVGLKDIIFRLGAYRIIKTLYRMLR